MGIHLEPVVLILRAGKNLERFGDPYEFTATIHLHDGTAHVVAGIGEISLGVIAELRGEFKAMGIREVAWSRMKNGKKRNFSYRMRSHAAEGNIEETGGAAG